MKTHAVLIANNDPVLCAQVEDILRQEGCAALRTTTFRGALDLAARYDPDVALVDLELPDGSGDELVAELKRTCPHCACIVLTADPDVDSAAAAFRKGAANYLQKPIRPRELLQLLVPTFEMIRVRAEHFEAESALRQANQRLQEEIAERKQAEKALRESEARLRSITDNSFDYIMLLDRQGNIRFVNRTLPDLVEEDVIGTSVYDYLPPDSRAVMRRCLAGVLETGKPDRYEVEHHNSRGDVQFFEGRVAPVEQSGEVVAFTVSSTDITERKLTEQSLEEALRESERAGREAAALVRASRAVLKHESFDDAAQTIFNCCKELTGAASGYVALLSEDGLQNDVLFLDAGGLPCAVDPDLPMPVRGLRAEAYRSGKAVYENNFADSRWSGLLPGGHMILRNVLFAPMTIEGRPVGVIGIANKSGDFSEKDARLATAFGGLAAIALRNSRNLDAMREANRALRESEELYRVLVETSPDAVTVTDLEATITYASRRTLELHGFRSADEMLGKNAFELIVPEDRGRAMTNLKRTLQEGILRVPEYTLLRKDGTRFAAELSAALLRDSHGSPRAFMAVSRDITERKRTEEALRRAERLASIGTLAAGVAHEINNPLAAIGLYAKVGLLSKERAGAEGDIESCLEKIQEQVFRCSEIVKGVLKFARNEQTEKRPSDLRQVAHRARDLTRGLADRKGVLVQLELGETPQTVIANPTEMEQVFVNLVSNAIQASGSGDRVLVRFERTSGSVCVLVEDQGCGMTEEETRRAFDPFYTTRQNQGGTGLGLSVTYGIIEQHGGSIDVQSSPGQGTRVTFVLPLEPATTAGTRYGESPDRR